MKLWMVGVPLGWVIVQAVTAEEASAMALASFLEVNPAWRRAFGDRMEAEARRRSSPPEPLMVPCFLECPDG